ncbi:hypothetical protein BB561_006709 [Smittium simulii]|uniref:Uncharacterized protein n=1 Tax=Smittium simulii TaxID=133385 RepID=A0A2T9Y2E2_9FUNG|nr:hypothetical protein BB561_006709 [Smittium simulii]
MLEIKINKLTAKPPKNQSNYNNTVNEADPHKIWNKKINNTLVQIRNIQNNRAKQLIINSLIKRQNNEESTSDPEKIESIIEEFYSDLYNKGKTDTLSQNTLIGSIDRVTDDTYKVDLTANISIEEIKKTIKTCKLNSSPSPDGITQSGKSW